MSAKFKPVATSNFSNEISESPVTLHVRECQQNFRDEVKRLVREMQGVPVYAPTGKPRRRVHHSA